MKKILTGPNIQAIIFLVMSIVEAVLMILFLPIRIGTVLSVLLCNILCIAEIRFAYQLALWGNRWHSYWHRKNSNETSDEPSDFIVGLTTVSGYVLLLVLQIVLLIYVML